MQPKDIAIDQISIGDNVSFKRKWSLNDVKKFSELSGDKNPIHIDLKYAKQTKFKQRLVHGMLVASSCSALVGMYLPGKRCLYLGQTLYFRKPVFIGDTVLVTGKVKSKSLATSILEIEIKITKNKDVAVDGIAMVQILV